MKIIVDKYEYAKIIRGCYNVNNSSYGYPCDKCPLTEICKSPDDLEQCIEISDEKEGVSKCDLLI